MWQPSYDFDIFDIPFFSQLQAQEFGAATSFQASDPTSWVDYSIGRLMGVLQPDNPAPYRQRQFPAAMQDYGPFAFFQGGQAETSSETRARLQRVRDEADRLLKDAGGGGDCAEGRNILGGCGPILGSKKVTKHDGDTSGIGTTTPTGGRIGGATKAWFESLPAGSGTFIIGAAALIFILLFVKR